ncbi:hypothetical protein SAY87_028068 [Trapa incisa]|uniref:Uncharacterized protein n=1 Tax=Trapa incisa TaxID=236973 RepID=A0AAN7KUY8_9MYRT|nr:hypothetical protein SAY87_028068 [Trapa incisa]
MSMFPSCGLLNLNAQPSVHVIHQRLQELQNKTGPTEDSSKSKAKQVEEKEMLHVEKPQIDLNEFLQQMGILKGDDIPSEKNGGGPEYRNEGVVQEFSSSMSPFKEYDPLTLLEDRSFDWDGLIETQGFGDHQQLEAGGGMNSCQVYDLGDGLTLPSNIWNF